jgi:hypothetical protein
MVAAIVNLAALMAAGQSTEAVWLETTYPECFDELLVLTRQQNFHAASGEATLSLRRKQSFGNCGIAFCPD